MVRPGRFERQDYGIAMPSDSGLPEPFDHGLLRLINEPAWPYPADNARGRWYDVPVPLTVKYIITTRGKP